MLSAEALNRLCVLRQRKTAVSTRRKATAFRAKIIFAPTRGRSNPPTAGPMIPEIFICTPPRVAAEASSSLVTTSGITEVQAGALHAKPTPSRNTPVSNRKEFSNFSDPKTASPAADKASQTCITTSSFLRSTMSANAPAGKVRKKNGNDPAEDNSESIKGQADRAFITHQAAKS